MGSYVFVVKFGVRVGEVYTSVACGVRSIGFLWYRSCGRASPLARFRPRGNDFSNKWIKVRSECSGQCLLEVNKYSVVVVSWSLSWWHFPQKCGDVR